jgi:Tol biopolymer transport system component
MRRQFAVTGLAVGQRVTLKVQALYGSAVSPASAAVTGTAAATNLLVTAFGRPLAGRAVSGGASVGVDQPLTFTTYEPGLVHSSPPAFSPNRQYMAVSVQNGANGYPYQLVVRRTDGAGSPRFLTNDAGGGYSPAVSRDGKWIAFSRKASDGYFHLFRVPWAGGSLTMIPNSKSLDEPTWAPDGKSVWASRRDGTGFGIVRLTLGGTRTTVGGSLKNESPVVSPDGTSVAFLTRSSSGTNSSLKLLTVSSGSIRTLVSSLGGVGWRPSWTPNSAQIYWVVTSSTTSTTYLKRISRTGSGYGSLPSLGTTARYVVYEQW